MQLGFDSLEITNFKVFADGPHVFELDRLGAGLHYVRGLNEKEPRLGPNGAGKSSVWDALTWCLYGKTAENLRNPDIAPWHGGKKKTAVAVRLRIDDVTYVVTRTANPNALKLNGETVGQERVEQLIGLSFDAFVHTILLAQGHDLFFDLAPRDKMQLFSDALNLNRWESRSKLASDRCRALELDLSNAEGVVEVLESTRENLLGLSKRLKQQSADWALDRKDKLRTAWEELEEVKRQLENAETSVAEWEPKLDWAETQLKGVLGQLKDADQVYRSDGLAADKLRAVVEDLEERKLELEAGLKQKVPTCPTCLQPIRDKAHMKGHLEELKTELAKQAEAADAAQRAADSSEKVCDTLREAESALDDEIADASAKLRPLQSRVTELKLEAKNLQAILDQGEDEPNPYHKQLQDIKKQLAKNEADAKTEADSIAVYNRRIERAKFWVKGFKDLRLNLIEDVLQELELATNAMLDEVGLVDWSVKYDVEKETKSGTTQRGLNVMILAPDLNKRVKWECYSGGEGQRLRVIGALALSEVLLAYAGVEPTTEILDEPVFFMAPEGVKEFIDFLAWRADNLGRAIFLTDHHSMDSGRFSSITTIVKDKKTSRIEQ